MKRFSAEVLKDERAPVIALLMVVLAKYGVECMDYQPEFLRKDLNEDFNVDISDLQSDKIQAGMTILKTDLFEAQWEVFKTVCHLLNSIPDSFEENTPLEAEVVAAAMAHYKVIVEDDVRTPFSDEVCAYVGQVFHHYGMVEAPSLFPNAMMPESNEMNPEIQSEKNEALNSLYDAHIKNIQKYVDSLLIH